MNEFTEPVREIGRFLIQLQEETGRDAHLGFEPEPFGQFDNTEESLAFFRLLFHAQPDADQLRQRLGLTYDTCHFSLQFECPRLALDTLRGEGIRISRIQASNALSLDPRYPGALEKLASYDEPVYFHQVVVNGLPTGALKTFPDLPEALTWASRTDDPGKEWRCHFHIPIGSRPEPPLGDTNGHLLDVIRYQRENPGFTPHWEAETYTWGVLPGKRKQKVNEQIAGELRWLRSQFITTNPG